MKEFITKHLVVFLWLITAIGAAVIIFLWLSRDIRTNQNTSESNQIVSQIQDALNKHQQQTEADHDGQDALIVCIGQLFLEKDQITEVDFEECVIKTAVPPVSEGGDTAPQPQGNGSSNQSSGNSSSHQHTPPGNNSQSNNSQNGNNGNNDKPDNEGIIIDLPLIPKVNIPSPL